MKVSLLAAGMAVMLCLVATAQAEMIANAGFETGDWTDWMLRATDNGQTAVQDVVMYDIDGAGVLPESFAGHLSVARVASGSGGGMEVVQELDLTAGTQYTFFANLSVYMAGDYYNGDGGTFEFIVGDEVLATWASGGIALGYKYHELSGEYTATADGTYDVGIRVTRQFAANTDLNQYIDNVSFVPEPVSLALLVLGGVAAYRRR
ncbi:MAG: PEP-CTERM sorting domain-containing protein [Phycisphaerae bacterium]|jgi:hypothetical protein